MKLRATWVRIGVALALALMLTACGDSETDHEKTDVAEVTESPADPSEPSVVEPETAGEMSLVEGLDFIDYEEKFLFSLSVKKLTIKDRVITKLVVRDEQGNEITPITPDTDGYGNLLAVQPLAIVTTEGSICKYLSADSKLYKIVCD
ncbi:MAG: hypothetical protein SVU69_08200 [Pseudomonadota bacterium]|nr:hypothetical protein [Pseudomonadota bacterium]